MKELLELTNKLQDFFNLRNEWLLINQSEQTFLLAREEIEVEIVGNKILVSFLNEDGFQIWRIVEAEIEKEKIALGLTRNFGKETQKINLVPRALAEEFAETVELARLERVNKIAKLIAFAVKNVKVIRAELNRENGRFAELIIENKMGLQFAVLADVSDSLMPETLLTSAIILLAKLEKRKKNQINRIWILAEKRKAKDLQTLHACLDKKWKQKIKLKEVAHKTAERNYNPKQTELVKLKDKETRDLWRSKSPKLHLAENTNLSRLSQEIIELAPNEIDYLFSRNGETLRYLGLPFMRVRHILEREKAWFGIDRKRQILDENSYDEFYEMFENLKKYRRFASPNKQHAFYKASPEAWLESILRKDVKRLDANLILSPIYNQFYISREKIDLFALRKDRRLVIIELKVAVDREMPFQALDYWQKIELQRRKGKLDNAKLFGNTEIIDKSPVIYLAAPTLSYHRDLKLLSSSVAKDIEIFRFDLAENWRKSLKVLHRRRMR